MTPRHLRKNSLKTIALLVALVSLSGFGALSSAKPADAVGVADVRVDPYAPMCFRNYATDGALAAVFTPQHSGALDRVSLSLWAPDNSAPAGIWVRIFAVDNAGAYTGNELASAYIDSAAIPTSMYGFVDVDFLTPATVSAGTRVAIVAVPRMAVGQFRWDCSAAALPTAALHGLDSTMGWYWTPGFAAYVTPSAVTPSPAPSASDTLASTGPSGVGNLLALLGALGFSSVGSATVFALRVRRRRN